MPTTASWYTAFRGMPCGACKEGKEAYVTRSRSSCMREQTISASVFTHTCSYTYKDDFALVDIHGVQPSAELPSDPETVRLEMPIASFPSVHGEPDNWIDEVLPLQLSLFGLGMRGVVVCSRILH